MRSILFTQDVDRSFLVLRRRHLREGRVEDVLRLRRFMGVGYLRGGRRVLLQVTEDTRPDVGKGDWDAAPILRLYEPTGRLLAELGPGNVADLSPDGTTIAWTVPEQTRECYGAAEVDEDPECRLPSARVSVAPVSDLGSARSFGPYAEAGGLRWAGPDRVLLFGRHGQSWLIDGDGREVRHRIPGYFVDIDPATSDVLTTDDELHVLRRSDIGGSVAWERSFAPGRIEVAWSPDTNDALVQELVPGPLTGGDSRVTLVDTRDGAVRHSLADTTDGELHWSADGAWFAYRRLTPDDTFEFVLCNRASLKCNPAMAWPEGVQVLALEQ